MNPPKLMGKDWLDAQRVEYELVAVPTMDPRMVLDQLGIQVGQLIICELFIGKKNPVLAVHESTTKVDPNLLSVHVGDDGFRPATDAEIRANTDQEPGFVHPFIEGYLWKVLDEKIFNHDKIYIPSGKKNELICMDATALKYSVGVINGLIANITPGKE